MSRPKPLASRSSSTNHLRMIASAGPSSARADAQPTVALDLGEAYRRFAPYVAAIAIRIVGRNEDLDDLVQDVFVDAARGIASLCQPEAIKGWLAKITVRKAVRRLRRRRLLRALFLQDDEPTDYDSLVAPDASPEQRALVARIYRALDALSAEDRVAWVLRHVQGETLEEAARVCDCSLSTYQRRLRRATAQLASALPDLEELSHD